MAKQGPPSLRGGFGSVVDWFQGASLGMPDRHTPMRTVYDVKSGKYVELPLTEFQRLLRQGKIEESDSRTPHYWRKQKVYRLL
jgi:hypothetical protein